MFYKNVLITIIFFTFTNFAYSKDGYKDIKFDMPIKELLEFVEKNNATYFQEENQKEIRIEGLYKYDLDVWFDEDSMVEGVTVIVFDEKYRDKYFVLNNSGIDKFEELKTNLESKYKLLAEPDDLEIDKYNNDAMGDSITYSYLSNEDPKIIIGLSLQTYNHVKYIATISYNHPKWTDAIISYLNKSSVDSSDDF